MRKPIFSPVIAVGLALVYSVVHADVWQPPQGHTQVPIWPTAVPDALPAEKAEGAEMVTDSLIAGKPWMKVTNVSQPTMTVYSPKGENTGAAVLVFPGGGYKGLAIDLEGTEIADWLVSKGITAILLKYRVPFSGPYFDAKEGRVYPKVPRALQDAQRALRLVRFHADEWHINPHRVGVIGFSAGGHLVAGMSTRYGDSLYPAVDEADKQSCRPDFAMALYPGHLWANEDRDPSTITDERFELRPDIRVTDQTPPTFFVAGNE